MAASEVILNDCGVCFDATSHTYTLQGKPLRGVTGTILNWLLPTKYADIPAFVLKKAAEHGSYVHSCIEMTDIVGATPDCPESQQYLDMMEEQGMKCIAHEYLVTDGKNFASAIDLVLMDADGEIILADIKCTSELYGTSVRAQLSIYAHWFEKLNPHLKVKGLAVVWLPKKQYGEPNWIKVSRTAGSIVERTIQAYLADEDCMQYVSEYLTELKPNVTSNTLPAQYDSIIMAIVEIEQKSKEIKEQGAKLKEELLAAFRTNGIKKLDNDQLSITYVAPSTRTTLDSKKLQQMHPEAYADCLKESETKDTIKITLKK